MILKGKKMGRQLLAGLLAVILLAGVAACKPSGGEGEPSGDVSAADKGPMPTTGVKGKVSYDEMMAMVKTDQAVNPNAIGYLHVPGTNISMSFIHNAEEDNEYYLDRKLDESVAGATYKNPVDTVVYAAQSTKFEKDVLQGSNNLVLFGHNWTNIRPPFAVGDVPEHTMFGQLPSFLDEDFATNTPYIYAGTADNEMVFKVFAVVNAEQDWTEAMGFNYIQPNLSTTQLSVYSAELMARSVWIYDDVQVGPDDVLVTLSTCTRQHDVGEEQRFIVVARLLRDGETDDAATTKISENLSMKDPNF